jgi:hypothetical protein
LVTSTWHEATKASKNRTPKIIAKMPDPLGFSPDMIPSV